MPSPQVHVRSPNQFPSHARLPSTNTLQPLEPRLTEPTKDIPPLYLVGRSPFLRGATAAGALLSEVGGTQACGTRARQVKLSCHKCRTQLMESAVSPWGGSHRLWRSGEGSRGRDGHTHTSTKIHIDSRWFNMQLCKRSASSVRQDGKASSPLRSLSQRRLVSRCQSPTQPSHSNQLPRSPSQPRGRQGGGGGGGREEARCLKLHPLSWTAAEIRYIRERFVERRVLLGFFSPFKQRGTKTEELKLVIINLLSPSDARSRKTELAPLGTPE